MLDLHTEADHELLSDISSKDLIICLKVIQNEALHTRIFESLKSKNERAAEMLEEDLTNLQAVSDEETTNALKAFGAVVDERAIDYSYSDSEKMKELKRLQDQFVELLKLSTVDVSDLIRNLSADSFIRAGRSFAEDSEAIKLLCTGLSERAQELFLNDMKPFPYAPIEWKVDNYIEHLRKANKAFAKTHCLSLLNLHPACGQAVLCEISADYVVYCLKTIDDKDFHKRIFESMSEGAGEMILDDLARCDSLSEEDALYAMQAFAKALDRNAEDYQFANKMLIAEVKHQQKLLIKRLSAANFDTKQFMQDNYFKNESIDSEMIVYSSIGITETDTFKLLMSCFSKRAQELLLEDIQGIELLGREDTAWVIKRSLKALRALNAMLIQAQPDNVKEYCLTLLELSPREIQGLMRDLTTDELLICLQAMDDKAFHKRIFENMSKRAAKLLFDDLANFEPVSEGETLKVLQAFAVLLDEHTPQDHVHMTALMTEIKKQCTLFGELLSLPSVNVCEFLQHEEVNSELLIHVALFLESNETFEAFNKQVIRKGKTSLYWKLANKAYSMFAKEVNPTGYNSAFQTLLGAFEQRAKELFLDDILSSHFDTTSWRLMRTIDDLKILNSVLTRINKVY